MPQVDSLILAVPLNNLPYISIGMAKPDMNEEDDKIDHILEDIVPEKEASITGMANLWNTLTKEFVQVAFPFELKSFIVKIKLLPIY